MAVRYLLDTNICIFIAKHNPPAVRARLERQSVNGEFERVAGLALENWVT